MRVVFAGTPAFSVPALSALYQSPNTDVVGVYTQPDRPAGRGKKPRPSEVKLLAQRHNTPVFQPTSFKLAANIDSLRSLEPDLMVVVAYGLILPQSVLDIPRLGCINIHASLLPRWRGAAPIQRAIEAGDAETGVALMQMEKGLDTGPVLAVEQISIGNEDTGGSLHDKLSILGGELLRRNLSSIENKELVPMPQGDEGVCYAHKLSKSESILDLRQPADVLARRIRAFNPWPATTISLDGKLLKILAASPATGERHGLPGEIIELDKSRIVVQTGSGGLAITRLQKPGGRAMSVVDFLNGVALTEGMSFDLPTAV